MRRHSKGVISEVIVERMVMVNDVIAEEIIEMVTS